VDRTLVGEFLGYISARSYRRHSFMASALAVEKAEGKPSFQFFKWMRKLGAIPSTDDDVVLSFWVDQVNRAYQHFASTGAPRGVREVPL
jgi:hypothetical protein